jgi:signal transduction histidine kinase
MNFITVTDAGPSQTRDTFFLPAGRAPRSEIERQHALLAGDPLIRQVLDSSLSLMAVLNAQRQAVLVNEAFRVHLGLDDSAEALGSRLGEYMDCRRASEAPSGCGTSMACRDCGAARAMASAAAGRAAVNPCRIQTAVCGRDLTLTVSVTPFPYAGERFLLVSALDVGHEARRRELEQIFFHDVLNTASGVQGLLHFMQDASRETAVEDCLPIARRASDTLIDELVSQRDLTTAENGDLKITRKAVSTRMLLAQLGGMLASHPLAKDRRIVVDPDSDSLTLMTDETLLSRVLLNLIKNALEAIPMGASVTVSCRHEGGSAVFLVHNPGCIPQEGRSQIFQRSYSTKGAGRGLGTYSIRLLTENYLGGTVGFASDPEQGTTFRVAYPLEPTAHA